MVTFHRRLPKFEYIEPHTIEQALSTLAEYKGRAKVIAGGTDILPKLKRREIQTPEYLVSLKRIPDLDFVRYDDAEGLDLGALVTIRAAEMSPIVQHEFGILYQAAASMASPQVRNRATLAGNICNAVPSADAAPALLTLEATLWLSSPAGERAVSVHDFFTGPNKTVLGEEELVREIHVPKLPPHSRGRYLKLTTRSSMDLALVGVAAVVVADNGICNDIRIALGAVAPTPMRARRAEGILRGERLTDEKIEMAAHTAAAECRPISDHRASAEYRCHMVQVLTRQAIRQAIQLFTTHRMTAGQQSTTGASGVV